MMSDSFAVWCLFAARRLEHSHKKDVFSHPSADGARLLVTSSFVGIDEPMRQVYDGTCIFCNSTLLAIYIILAMANSD